MTEDEERPDGLRARKRAATRAAIERTAIELVREHGYDQVTVDMICDASRVSQRTFFNYFGSKEGVILGRTRALVPDGDALRFVNDRGEDVVHELATAMAVVLIDGEHDADFMRARFLIITNTPELMGRQMEWITAQESTLTDLVLARFLAEGRAADDLHDEARMVVGLAFTILRYTLQRLFVEQADRSADETLAHASALISRIVQSRPA